MELLHSPKLVLALLLVLFLALGNVNVMRSVGAAQVICNMTEEQLEACKPSVSGSNPSPPSAECCAALKSADLPCLCSYKNSGFLPALGIDPDLAMQLPSKCGVTAPSDCWGYCLKLLPCIVVIIRYIYQVCGLFFFSFCWLLYLLVIIKS